MAEKTSYITNSELRKAWKNWLYFHRGIHCEETEERFFKYCHTVEQSFIDDMLNWDDGKATYHVAQDTAQRVVKAAGPYFNTIFSAYYAKHPWTKR